MAFDQSTRKKLADFVSDARSLLTEEFTRQLQNEYGLDPESGTITGLEKLTALNDTQRETARILRETLDYYLAGKADDKKNRQDVLQRIVREQAFTVLNRLCALRMAESRGILIESIAKGYQSKGFQLYARLAGTGLGETSDAYSSYLFSLFDEFAVDLAVLFDRFNPQGRVFPRQTTLVKLLDLINDLEIEQLWTEDETIGWMYQYFNTKEERKEMRDASQAPRNSRELAVRNQFFTPRYVVEFLTDNTLGRIWYEITKGETSLKDSCHYLVRRPTEIFLKDGEVAPVQANVDEDLSQEELLNQPVYIPHRPLKDPREIKMLDPACGSMHFGLYAFDLFEQIYAEAWDLEESQGDKDMQLGDLKSLHFTYQTREDFLRDVPRLIIERNIHGVDIDPRAVQIAGLSLWLRAQKSWHALGVKPQDRPQIRRSNIVCAEPMPGDRELLEEFLETFKEDRLEALMRRVLHVPAEQKVRTTKAMANALANLVRTVWQEMELAGEAGSLLQIEVTLREAIEKASNDSKEKAPLFSVLEFGADNLSQYDSSDTNGNFWSWAEALVLEALQEYSELSENGGSYQRHLFAADAVQGFAFIDLCLKHYEIVLMNPPFGDPSKNSKEYLSNRYFGQPYDLYSDFIERFIFKSDLIGAITSHTFLTYGTYSNYRIKILFPNTEIRTLADFGLGVMDAAMVRSAAYILDTNVKGNSGVYFSLVEDENKELMLKNCLQLVKENKSDIRRFVVKQNLYSKTDQYSYAYWAADSLLNLFDPQKSIGEIAADILLGVVTSGNEQFLRLAWEVDPKFIKSREWSYYYKGGDFQKYFRPAYLTIDWRENGNHIRTGNSSAVRLRDTNQYFKSGLTYPLINEFGMNVSVLPGNCVFDNGSPAVFGKDDSTNLFLLGLLNSRIAEFFIRCLTSTRHWQVGYVRQLPMPSLTNSQIEDLSKIVSETINLQRHLLSDDEVTQDFYAPPILTKYHRNSSLNEIIRKYILDKDNLLVQLLYFDYQVDEMCLDFYQLTDLQKELVKRIIGPHPVEISKATNSSQTYQLQDENLRIHRVTLSHIEDISWKDSIPVKDVVEHRARYPDLLGTELSNLVEDSISYLIGCAFGRWDIHYATGQKEISEFSDPLSLLPACSLGMLQNSHGLPAVREDITAEYPLRISWSGILVDDEGHYEDVVGRLREAQQVIWQGHSDAIEQESCQILDIHSLREYFTKSFGFFADHLKRYSKNRRQAPIYWPLSTPSNSYTLWLYYHRLNDQTLFICVIDFVDPKIKQVSEETKNLRQKKSRSSAEEKELEYLTDFEHELKDFRDELLRVAKFWKPNLNDGVQITAAPLWKLFQHKPWQKKLRETWESLEAGEYDWAHLAYSIWPERVREKCKTDKSLAIAHDLEHLYVEPKAPLKKKAGRKKKTEMEELFDEDN